MKFSTSNFLAYPLAVIYSEFFPSARIRKNNFLVFEAKSSKPKIHWDKLRCTKVTAGMISLPKTQSEGAPVWAHRNSPQRKHPTRQLGVWWSFFGGTETETNSKTDPAWSTFLKKSLCWFFAKGKKTKTKRSWKKKIFFLGRDLKLLFCFGFLRLTASFWHKFFFLHTWPESRCDQKGTGFAVGPLPCTPSGSQWGLEASASGVPGVICGCGGGCALRWNHHLFCLHCERLSSFLFKRGKKKRKHSARVRRKATTIFASPLFINFCVRPYYVENTVSRLICEVKPRQARWVLRWVTTRETWVLYAFLFFKLSKKKGEKKNVPKVPQKKGQKDLLASLGSCKKNFSKNSGPKKTS